MASLGSSLPKYSLVRCVVSPDHGLACQSGCGPLLVCSFQSLPFREIPGTSDLVFAVTKALPSMYTSMEYGVYIFFATMLIFAAIYAFFFIQETRGLRMDQMDEIFGFLRENHGYVDKALDDPDQVVYGEDSEKSKSARVEVA